jgi:hypothetical protein
MDSLALETCSRCQKGFSVQRGPLCNSEVGASWAHNLLQYSRATHWLELGAGQARIKYMPNAFLLASTDWQQCRVATPNTKQS